MPGAHRIGDARFCGATTKQKGQSTVFVNTRLWAVYDDPNTHGDGGLIPVTGTTVFIEGRNVIVALGDKGKVDNASHVSPETDPKESSTTVFSYG
jgi:hypothetical protein